MVVGREADGAADGEARENTAQVQAGNSEQTVSIDGARPAAPTRETIPARVAEILKRTRCYYPESDWDADCFIADKRSILIRWLER